MAERLKKLCKRCDKMYDPIGKFQKYCEPCKEELHKESVIKRKNKPHPECKVMDHMNFNLYKEQAEIYKKAMITSLKTLIKKCPREILIDILKSEKIISRDWYKQGEGYKLKDGNN